MPLVPLERVSNMEKFRRTGKKWKCHKFFGREESGLFVVFAAGMYECKSRWMVGYTRPARSNGKKIRFSDFDGESLTDAELQNFCSSWL